MMMRLITRVIFLHMMVCLMALAMVGLSLFSIVEFVQDARLPSVLQSEAQIEEVPLVLRDQDHWDARKSAWLCHVPEGHLVLPYLRKEDPSQLESLKLYRHRDIIYKVVEVPANPSWISLFEAIEGRSLLAACGRLAGIIAMTAVIVNIAIRGYWLIKHGPKRRQHRYRR